MLSNHTRHSDYLRVLVVGGGAREHALCDCLSQSERLSDLLCLPGNAGIAEVARCIDGVGVSDVSGIASVVKREEVDLVVIGPEAPLIAGLADTLRAERVAVFGPSAAAARLEGSKSFSKDFMHRHGIPTAAYRRFTDAVVAKQYVRQCARFPVVIKADGLAAGKGVLIVADIEQAERAIDDMLVRQVFGAAGREIVIEEYLRGTEASFFALVDGECVVPLLPAQDHKAAFDGDRGPNTGGMGAYAPAPVVTADMADAIMRQVVRPTAAGMVREGTPFQGVLYCGLMLTDRGDIRVLEYNVRFGDPECQVLCVLLESDLLQVLHDAAVGRLDAWAARGGLTYHPGSALTVVLASRGYPSQYATGSRIGGLEQAAAAAPDVKIFHAGTGRGPDGAWIATGGRVLSVTARAPTLAEAQRRAYAAVHRIEWPEGFYRTDIGWRALAMEVT